MGNDYRRKEQRVRQILSKELNTHVRKGKLEVGHRSNGSVRKHEFDIVAKTPDGLVV